MSNCKYRGSCLCRSVRYEAEGEPIASFVCHCENCRKSSGSAFSSDAVFVPENVAITHGSDVIKKYTDNETDSGKPLYRWFCSNCGSSLFSTNDENIWKVVKAGTLNKDIDWSPANELYVQDKRNWVTGIKLDSLKARAEL